MINKDLLLIYLDRYSNATGSDLEVVTDFEIMAAYERENDMQIGVIKNQPYYDIVLPLYRRKGTDIYFRYPFLAYPKDKRGAATLIVIKCENEEDKFLLEHHYREFHHAFLYEICRGFGISAGAETAVLELYEETGLNIEKSNLIPLGEVIPDSGVSNNTVDLFACELKGKPNLHLVDQDEQISGYRIMTENEILRNVSDSFTLAALFRYRSLNEKNK